MAHGVLEQKRRQRRRLEWQSAVPALIPGAECCPSAIDEYVDTIRTDKKATDAILLNVRKHLLYSGWKIDSVLDGEVIRLRYSSPEGRYFYSLPQVCASFGHGRQDSVRRPPVSTRPKTAATPSEKTISSSLSEEPAISDTKSLDVFNPDDEVLIEPQYCPEAVRDYCLHSSDKGWKPGAMKAKQHLSAIGWSFYYTLKGGITKELRYSSPNGRVFNSLLAACKWSVGTTALTFGNMIGKIGKANPPLMDRDFLNLPKVSSETGGVKKTIGGHHFSKRGRKKKTYSASKRVKDVLTSSCHQNPRTVLSWLIDSDVVLPRARVEYRGKNGLSLADGRICREGIKCNCCGVLFTLTKFEAHAGRTNHRPSANIFLADGRSLMDCQRQLKQRMGNSCSMASRLRIPKEKRRAKDVETSSGREINEDICSICLYGGELLLCDRCPSSFHIECLGLKEVPDGDWFCPSCCCQICGLAGFEVENGQVIGCSVLTCSQCEHRYHDNCLRNKGITSRYSGVGWFCEDTCEQIYSGLRKILGEPFLVGTDNLTWTLLKSDPHDQYEYDEEELLEVYGKLNVVLGVMHECFEPLKVPGTERDLVEDVIFSKWSEANRNNFGGFYTVVLEKNDELISAATVRIYGKRVAEVPLVATRFRYRRLGMCRILMSELEKKLVELGVERLVLPAVPSVLSTWTNSFGFSVMDESDRSKFLGCNFLGFQGTVFCQKILKASPWISSQTTGNKVEESCYRVNGNIRFDLDGHSIMSEVVQGDQREGIDFIDQDSTWWIDELLMSN